MLLNASPQAITLKAKLFRGFADPSRLALLDALTNGPLTVTQLVEVTGLTQSNVSNHLGCLRDCGLVTREQRGQFVSYQIGDERVSGMLELADRLLSDVAKEVYDCTRYNRKEGDNGRADD